MPDQIGLWTSTLIRRAFYSTSCVGSRQRYRVSLCSWRRRANLRLPRKRSALTCALVSVVTRRHAWMRCPRSLTVGCTDLPHRWSMRLPGADMSRRWDGRRPLTLTLRRRTIRRNDSLMQLAHPRLLPGTRRCRPRPCLSSGHPTRPRFRQWKCLLTVSGDLERKSSGCGSRIASGRGEFGCMPSMQTSRASTPTSETRKSRLCTTSSLRGGQQNGCGQVGTTTWI